MKKLKQMFSGKKSTVVLFLVAGILLISGGVGSAKAALTYYSEHYTAQMEVPDIGVSLVEKSASGSKNICNRDYTGSSGIWEETSQELLQDMLQETGGKLLLGRKYVEKLSVKNSGKIDEYVRVTLVKSWVKKDGTKETTLAPTLIELHMTQNGWLVDEAASTEERTVLYWPQILPVGKTTLEFLDSLKISEKIASKVKKETTTEGAYTTVTTTFLYDDVSFLVEAEVDAVQTHNAKDAIKSAWGIDVNIADDGTLSLVP